MSVIQEITNKFEPVQILTVFKDKNRNYYIEATPIDNGRAQASKPLTEDTIIEVVEYFSNLRREADSINGKIPSNLLYSHWTPENKVLVWYNAEQERTMHFTPSLHISSGSAQQPTLVYIMENDDLYVFAAKKNRIQLDTQVFIAPYHNCSDNGVVCLGSAKLNKPQKPTYENMMEYWEKKFWMTEFSHLNSEKVAKVNINIYWKDAIKKQSGFDYSILLPNKHKTVMDNLKNIFRHA